MAVHETIYETIIELSHHVVDLLRKAMTGEAANVRAHARATEQLLRDPEAAFAPDVEEAKRIFALGRER